MIAYIVGGLAIASIVIAVLFYYVRHAREVWRGDTSRIPIQLGRMITVTPHTYPSALLCVGTLSVAFALGGIAFALVGHGREVAEHLLIAAGIMLLANVVLVPLNWFVEATNRPKFPVPPPCRGQPGSLAAARRRRRRRRRRAGLPQTDHLVEIFQVRPEPDDDNESFLVAICADQECGWMEFADDVLDRSEEEQLRAKAAGHTTNVSREVQRRR